MSEITRAGAEGILGAVDDNTFAALKATGASLAEIIEAKALADGTSDIAGQGEQVLSGPTKEVLIILGEQNR